MRNNLLIFIILLLTCCLSMAQSHNEEVTVEGSYTPHIKKSERLTQTPDTPKHEFNIPHYEVNTEDFFYSYKIESEPISPIQYKQNGGYDITNNFIKLGLGTRLSPDLIFRHYSDITRRMSLGLGITHNSTWLGMKDYDNAKYMNNAFKLSTTNRFSGFQLHSYINYHYDTYHLNYDNDYDYDNDGDYDNDYDNDYDGDANTRREIHSLNVKLLANNNQTSYKSLYNEFLLDYSYTGIQGGIQENLAKFKAHLEHSNSWFRKNNGVQTLSADIEADINNISQTLFLISANPYLAFDGEYYNLHLGFRVDAKTNTASMGGIYPDIKGSLYLFERNFEVYAGLGGKTKINTLKEILTENPFIISDMTKFGEFDYEKTKIDFQGGLNFKVLNKVSTRLGIRYRNVNNYIFFKDTYNELGTFDIVLDNCTIFNFLADIQMKINDDIKVAADFAYNHFERVGQVEPWYEPKVKFNLRGFYNLDEKWNFNITTYFEGKRYAYKSEFKSMKLKPVCDIQLGCDYNLNDELSFYAEIKNLIHNKYQMYYGYPSYGFQAFLGFKYRF